MLQQPNLLFPQNRSFLAAVSLSRNAKFQVACCFSDFSGFCVGCEQKSHNRKSTQSSLWSGKPLLPVLAYWCCTGNPKKKGVQAKLQSERWISHAEFQAQTKSCSGLFCLQMKTGAVCLQLQRPMSSIYPWKNRKEGNGSSNLFHNVLISPGDEMLLQLAINQPVYWNSQQRSA